MKTRVYIHAPRLPNTVPCLQHILRRVFASYVGADADQFNICHSPGYGDELKASLIIGSHGDYHELDSGSQRFEYPTLRKLWLDSKHADFRALYLHAKGGSKTTKSELQNAATWTDTMLGGVLSPVCLMHLASGADLVGALYHWHFKGNFWWADSRYLRQLPDPYTLGTERFNAEYWNCWGLWNIGAAPKPRVKNLFYLPGLINDDFTTPGPVEHRRVFTDRRLDPRAPCTLEAFLASNYKCAFDRADVLPGCGALLRDYMNYDSEIHERNP